jgi:PAS domain S-box-containing protein
MRDARRSPSIQVIFRRGFLTFSLTSLIVFGIIVYWRFFIILNGETHAQLVSESAAAESLVSVFVEDHLDRLTIVASNGDIRTALEDFDRQRNNRQERVRLLASVEKVLIAYRNNLGSSVAELLVVDSSNSECIVDIMPTSAPKLARNLIGEIMDDAIIRKGKQKPVANPFLYNSRLGFVTLAQAAPVYTDRGDVYVIVQHVDAAALAENLQERMLVSEKPWNVRLFTQTGATLTPEVSTPVTMRGDVVSNQGVMRAISGKNGTQYYTSDTGEYVIGSFSMMRGNQAIVLVELPYKVFLTRLATIGIILAATPFILAVLLMIVASVQAGRFSHPVTQLVARCREIAEGDWESMVEIAGIREFELLGNSFNAMARDLSTSFRERERITRSIEETNRLLMQKMTELEESGWRYRDLYERSQDGLFTSDTETGYYTLFNAKFCEILNYSVDEMAGITINDIIPPEERSYADEQRLLRMRGECIDVPYELYIKRKNGEYRYVEVYSRPVAGTKLVTGSIRDVTERVMLEKDIIEKNIQLEYLNESLNSLVNERTQTLVALKEIHEKIIANVPVGVMVVEQNLNVSFVNDQMAQVCTGMSNTEPLLGCSLKDQPELLPEGMVERIKACLKGRDFHLPQVIFSPQGTDEVYYLDIWAVPLVGGEMNIEGALIIAADQTRQVMLRAELANSTRLAATGQLAASLAHEINNPLNSIRYNLELAKMDIEDLMKADIEKGAANMLEYLRIINREIDRVGDIVRNLLDLHRTPKAGPAPVDLNSVIDDVLVLMRKQIFESGVTVNYIPDPAIKEVNGIAGQIKQIALNMLLNAIQAIEGKGRIEIKTGSTDKYGWFAISDNGVGIPENVLPRIFEPFFSTKGLSGVGLGLAICESIVNQFRGRIHVDSMPGEGMTFTVYLPLYGTDED